MLECYTLLGALAAAHVERSRSARWSPATRTATRRCWPRPSPRSTSSRAAGRSSASAPAGSSSSTTRSASSSARSPSASRSSRRRCRSSRGDVPRRAPDLRRASTTGVKDASTRRRRSGGGIPIMIGGSGEKKTLRMVAQYADESNLTCGRRRDPPQARRARRPLRRRRAATPARSPRRRWHRCASAPTRRRPRRMRTDFLAGPGHGLGHARRRPPRACSAPGSSWATPTRSASRSSASSPLGLDGFILNLPANGHDPDSVTFARRFWRGDRGLEAQWGRPLSSIGRRTRHRAAYHRVKITTDVRAGPCRAGTAQHNRIDAPPGRPSGAFA